MTVTVSVTLLTRWRAHAINNGDGRSHLDRIFPRYGRRADDELRKHTASARRDQRVRNAHVPTGPELDRFDRVRRFEGVDASMVVDASRWSFSTDEATSFDLGGRSVGPKR